MNNKILLLQELPHSNKSSYLFPFIFLIILVLFSFIYKTYDSYNLTGLILCSNECIINVTIPYNKVDTLSKKSKIEYLNKEYEIIDIVFEEPYLDSGIPYEDVKIHTNIKSEDKIINFKVLYNKQRIIRKVKSWIER